MINSFIVYDLVRKIPRSKVATYGLVAKILCIKNPRLIGKILHQNPDPKTIPCHRVVNARGEVAGNFAFGGAAKQREKLEQEGVIFLEGKVDLKKHLWIF